MIISGKPVQNVVKAYGEQNQAAKSAKVGKTPNNQGKDEFILSSGAQEFGQIFNTIRRMPEVRKDKVQEFSEKINGGTYQVDAKSVADRILGAYSGL